MLRLPVSFQMTWFGTSPLIRKKGLTEDLCYESLRQNWKCCGKKKLIYILQSNNCLIPRCPWNTISVNNIGSKGHWWEPDKEMGTKLYDNYSKFFCVRMFRILTLLRHTLCKTTVMTFKLPFKMCICIRVSQELVKQSSYSMYMYSLPWIRNIKIIKLSHVMRKPVFAICEQQRRRSACASSQSDQRLCYSLLR